MQELRNLSYPNSLFYESLYSNSELLLDSAKKSLSMHARDEYVNAKFVIKTIDNILNKRSPLGLKDSDIALILVTLFDYRFTDDVSNLLIKYSTVLRRKTFSNFLSTMVPIEVSSYCASNCKFCGWKSSNKDMIRLRINDDGFFEQLKYLVNMGFTHIEIASGDDLDFIKNNLNDLIKKIKFYYPQIRLSICLTPLSTNTYNTLLNSGLDAVLTWQETYNKDLFNSFITSGPKSKGINDSIKPVVNGNGFLDRMMSQERALESGLQVGLGVMLGLSDTPGTDILSLILHGKYLIQKFSSNIKPLIIGMPTWNHITTENYDIKNSEVSKFSIENLFPAIASLYFISFEDKKAWIFANCRVSMKTQVNTIQAASVFTSTMVLLGPGAYLKKSLITSSFSRYFSKFSNSKSEISENELLLGEQFKHYFYEHSKYIDEFERHGLSICSDADLLKA
ncbi:MAG: hypothetical protein L6Q37_00060 [Bdellovibrionaceae bacterium]|nr:hypothetical protein [Pseudobdellovibrionaceae bacterium]NUM58522.1 hypothetical protein [Pseudobdellovibrionaceae bacterium]